MSWAMVIRSALVGMLVLCGSGAAQAQTFPNKPIQMMVFISAGGVADLGGRLYADKVGSSIGQRVVVENRPGGTGSVAATALMQAPPDGHTLLLTAIAAHTIVPMMQKPAYDPIKDFQPVTLLFSTPMFLVVPAASPANSAAELVKLAATKPDGLSYGSQGVGSSGHLLGSVFQGRSGAAMVHVPYKGSGPMLTDLLTSRIDFTFTTFSTMEGQRQDLKILAVASPERWEGLPNVPTMAEAGFPGVDYDTWFTLLAPQGTPAGVVEKLRSEFQKASQQPDLREKLNPRGLVVKTSTPAEVTQLMISETEKYRPVIKALGLHVN
jgi:tripartite-type tricarboxylate transporter receptor subunit TctC